MNEMMVKPWFRMRVVLYETLSPQRERQLDTRVRITGRGLAKPPGQKCMEVTCHSLRSLEQSVQCPVLSSQIQPLD